MRAARLYCPPLTILAWAVLFAVGLQGFAVTVTALVTLAWSLGVHFNEVIDRRIHRVSPYR